jgi:predicted dehydrogenase
VVGGHAHSYARIPEAELVGFVDPNRGEELAQRYNVPLYRSLGDVSPQDYDAIDVCAPTFLHRSFVLEAARLGKPAFSEKPVALNLEDADAMVRAMGAKNLAFSVGHVVRFFPEYVRAKRAVDDGTLGRVAVARMARLSGCPRGWNDWYVNRKLSGGTLFDLMIHDIDYVRWVFGPVERVYAKTLQNEMNLFDMSLVTLRFKNGTIAHLQGSWAHSGFTTYFELAGSRGLISHDRDSENPLSVVTRNPKEVPIHRVEIPDVPSSKSPYQLELESWLANIIHGTPLLVTGEDAYEAVRIALAAKQSQDTGMAIEVANPNEDVV